MKSLLSAVICQKLSTCHQLCFNHPTVYTPNELWVPLHYKSQLNNSIITSENVALNLSFPSAFLSHHYCSDHLQLKVLDYWYLINMYDKGSRRTDRRLFSQGLLFFSKEKMALEQSYCPSNFFLLCLKYSQSGDLSIRVYVMISHNKIYLPVHSACLWIFAQQIFPL